MADWVKFKKFFESRNVAKCAPHLIRYLKSDSKIIDVGCGTGTITRDFAKRVPQGSAVGVDIKSIATAKAEAEKEGLTNVEFIVGNVEDVSQFPDNTFDIAHAHQVMIHLAHPVDSLRHVYRIIKPGGVAGIRDLSVWSQPGNTATMDNNLNRFWADTRARGAKGEGAGSINHIWMHEAGFKWENIERGAAGYENEQFELEALVEGQMAFAKLRGETNEYLVKLREEWEVWLARPETRAMGLDGWVVGTK